MSALADVLATFGRSDLASGLPDPRWYRWCSATGTHALFGLVLALGWSRLAAPFFALWVAKELAFDMPGGRWVSVVVLDSLADLSAGAAGYAFGRWRMQTVALRRNQ